MKLKNILKTIIVLFLFSNSLNASDVFHYYDFKNQLSITSEDPSFCWYCPKDIQTPPFPVINNPNITYAEKRYGKKVKHVTHEEMIAESKKPNSHLLIGMNKSSTTTHEKIFSENPSNGAVSLYDEKTKIGQNNNWTIDMLTLFPVKYFGFDDDPKDIYISTKMGSSIDLTFYKDLANGRDGDFYFMLGGGTRFDIKADAGNKMKMLFQAKTGLFISTRMGIWLEATYTNPEIAVIDEKLYKAEQHRNEMFEYALYLGFRF